MAVWLPFFFAMLLLVSIGLIYGRTADFEFTLYDESEQIVENPLAHSLAPANIVRMFSRLSISSYYPIRLLSFAIDYRLGQGDPAIFHLTNVLLHALNTLLLMWLILRIAAFVPGASPRHPSSVFGQPKAVILAAFAAGLFALHPVAVEPVAWIGGREELLMLMFGLGSLHFHVTARRWASERAGLAKIATAHLLATICAICSALSNVVGVVFPAVLLTFDMIALRIRRPKPLLTGTGAIWLGAITLFVVKKMTHRVDATEAFMEVNRTHAAGDSEHLLNIIYVYMKNVLMVFWPHDLHLLYPNLTPMSFFQWEVLLGLAFMAGTGAALVIAWRWRWRDPLPLVGLLWVLIVYAPYSQVLKHHIDRADRFLYLTLAMLAATVAFTGIRLLPRLKRAHAALFIGLPAAALLVLLAVLSYDQVPHWRNSLSVFSRTVRLNPLSASGHNNMGMALVNAGRLEEALESFDKAIENNPFNDNAWSNKGLALAQLERFQEAVEPLTRGIGLDMKNVPRLKSLAEIYRDLGQPEAVLPMLEKAEEVNTQNPEFFVIQGISYARVNRLEQAAEAFQRALELDSDCVEAHTNMAKVRLQQTLSSPAHYADQIVWHCTRALELNPKHAEAHFYLSFGLALKGDPKKAMQHYDEARQIDPKYEQSLQAFGRKLMGRFRAAPEGNPAEKTPGEQQSPLPLP